MKIIRYILIMVVMFAVVSFTYNYSISPRLIIINHSNLNLKLYKSETNLNFVEPTMEEVEKMFNSSVVINPNSSYLTNISKKYLFSDQNKLNASLTNGSKNIFTGEFLIQKKGFCSYKVSVYKGSIEIETSKFNLCYKKLHLLK